MKEETRKEHYANCDLVVCDGECTCGVSENNIKSAEVIADSISIIEILYKIAKKTGYNFFFENVSIDLDGKNFSIKGSQKENTIIVVDGKVGIGL